MFTFAPNRGAATYFLCFAKESKQRKATPTCRSASQTSLTPHPFFGACELAALRAPSDKRTLVSEKKMLRSAGRRGVGSSVKRLLWINQNRQPENWKWGFYFQAVFRLTNNAGHKAVDGIAQDDEFAVEEMPAFGDNDEWEILRGAPC